MSKRKWYKPRHFQVQNKSSQSQHQHFYLYCCHLSQTFFQIKLLCSCPIQPLLSFDKHPSLLGAEHNLNQDQRKSYSQYTCPQYQPERESLYNHTQLKLDQYFVMNFSKLRLSIYLRMVSNLAACAQFPKIAMTKMFPHHLIKWHIQLGWLPQKDQLLRSCPKVDLDIVQPQYGVRKMNKFSNFQSSIHRPQMLARNSQSISVQLNLHRIFCPEDHLCSTLGCMTSSCHS